jgi:hypothetical protein
MAIATLVATGAHRLRYLIAAEGTGAETVNITTVGTATPDTLTDSQQGTIKALSKVVANGYAQLAAGVQTQAKARALWLGDISGASPSGANPDGDDTQILPPVARCLITPRSGNLTSVFGVDANIDGGGNPVIVCGVSGGGDFYLDVEVPNTIGV